MAEQLFYLTENDRDLLRDFVERELRGRNHSRSRYGIEGENSQSPDVYVVRTPNTGIPALDVGSTTGSGSLEDDTPGSAECDVYRLVQTGGTYDLKPTGVTRRIYNLSLSSLSGGTWTPVARDKFGTWYALPVGAGFSGCRKEIGSGGGANTNPLLITGTVDVFLDWSSTIGGVRDIYDVGGYFSSAHHTRLTAPASGYYTIGGCVDIGDSNVAGGVEATLQILKNYPSLSYSTKAISIMARRSDGLLAATIETVTGMDAGDYVELLLTSSPIVTPQNISWGYLAFWMNKVG